MIEELKRKTDQTYFLVGKDRFGVRWLEAPLIQFSDLKVVTAVADFNIIALYELLRPDWVVVDWRLPDYFKEEFKLLVVSNDGIFAEVGTPDPDSTHPYLGGQLWTLSVEGIEDIPNSTD